MAHFPLDMAASKLRLFLMKLALPSSDFDLVIVFDDMVVVKVCAAIEAHVSPVYQQFG
jgi:hypothetical protein